MAEKLKDLWAAANEACGGMDFDRVERVIAPDPGSNPGRASHSVGVHFGKNIF
jgi:hypothetical protein